MKVILILAFTGVLFSCRKSPEEMFDNKDFEVHYSVSKYSNGKIDTLIYIDEDGKTVSLYAPHTPLSFTKTFHKRKGFRSYLYVSGKYSGYGQVPVVHRVTNPNGTIIYEVDQENHNNANAGTLTYRTKGEFKIY